MRRAEDTGGALDVWRWRDTFALIGIASWSGLFLWLTWLAYERGSWVFVLLLASVAASAAYLFVGGLFVLLMEWFSARKTSR